MSDILKGLTSGLRVFLFAWAFPSAIAVAAFALWVFPKIDHLPAARDIADLTATQKTLVLGFFSFAVAVILNAADTRLYRLLEGYTWPERAQNWGINRQKRRLEKVKTSLEEGVEGWREALLYEELRRFPASDGQIVPTALGNALRAYEIYGANHFRLDSQFFWFELYSLAPDSLRTDYEDARANVDFFVATIFLSLALALVALVSAIGLNEPSLLWIVVPSLVVAPLAYRWSLDGISNWGSAIQAIVNVGRHELAQKLGLTIPKRTEDEREMWQRVHAFLFYAYDDDRATELDRFRDSRRDDDELT